ncbi:MAG TPA: hypothetical protein VFP10_06570 [Candidatus Eisenbacteria bacterium]|nr:hypothetical protein [Candidatus Eisenbacteria bacterium]
MDHSPDLELSLLEGMDEDLLKRLHDSGIRSRGELGQLLAGPESRRDLARKLRLPDRRLEVLYYLNFLLPEERAEMQLDLDQIVREEIETKSQDIRELRRLVLVTLATVVVAAVIMSGVLFISNRRASQTQSAALEKRLRSLEQTMTTLAPLGRAHAEDRIMAELNVLGPAPGWNAPRPWTQTTNEAMTQMLGRDQATMPARAVSLLLFRLNELEQAPWDSVGPIERARSAAELLAEFPPPAEVRSAWDAAAVVLRTRLRGRAAGLAPADKAPPLFSAADSWGWTAGEFLECEDLLARLEALPLKPSSLDEWSRSLVLLRQAADRGRDKRAGLPEQSARDYWLRRSELEYGVVAILLGRTDLFPYHSSPPRAFLEERERYVTAALERAPSTAKPALAWLALECAEAVQLADWLAVRGTAATAGGRKNWIDALDAVEKERKTAGLTAGPLINLAVARAASASGDAGDPWIASRTRHEAGLRPLLMTTRAGVQARAASAHATP